MTFEHESTDIVCESAQIRKRASSSAPSATFKTPGTSASRARPKGDPAAQRLCLASDFRYCAATRPTRKFSGTNLSRALRPQL